MFSLADFQPLKTNLFSSTTGVLRKNISVTKSMPFWRERSRYKLRLCTFCFFSWKLYCIIFKSFETPIWNGKQNSFEKRGPGPLTYRAFRETGPSWPGCHVIAKLIFMAFNRSAEIPANWHQPGSCDQALKGSYLAAFFLSFQSFKARISSSVESVRFIVALWLNSPSSQPIATKTTNYFWSINKPHYRRCAEASILRE